MARRLTIRVLGTFGVEVDGNSVPPEAWRQLAMAEDARGNGLRSDSRARPPD